MSSPPPTSATSPKPSWADEAEVDESSSSTSTVDKVGEQMSKVTVSAKEDDDVKDEPSGEAPLSLNLGLHPNDATAEVSVHSAEGSGVDVSIYKSASTFESLNLSQELLQGVYDMKFTAPSKIQAQSLPIILDAKHPNLIGQAHAGSGKCWGRGVQLLTMGGQPKAVEDIDEDDILMGPDGKPRHVMSGSLIASSGLMYRVTPVPSEDDVDVSPSVWSCNEDHVLVLSYNGLPWTHYDDRTRKYTVRVLSYDSVSKIVSEVAIPSPNGRTLFRSKAEADQTAVLCRRPHFVFEIELKELMKLSLSARQHVRMFHSSAVDFTPSNHSSLRERINRAFGMECTDELLRTTAWAMGVYLSGSYSPSVSVREKMSHWQSLLNPSSLHNLMDSYGLLNENSSFPFDLLMEEREVRYGLLGGFIDGRSIPCGPNEYEFPSLPKSLKNGFSRLCHGLGLAVNTYRHSNKVRICGDANAISAVVTQSMQKTSDCSQNHFDYLSFNFDIEPIGVDDYFGFQLDGPDGRCLLSDFTVTHNTAAFSLGLLSRVDPNKNLCQAIVVVPTRELAIQVHSVISQIAKFTKVKVEVAVKEEREAHDGDAAGAAAPSAAAAAAAAPSKARVTQQVVVGTPGQFLQKFKRRDIDPRNVVIMVADEADQIIDSSSSLGDQTLRVQKAINPKAQILLFSATFDEKVRKFARSVARNAIEITVKTEELSLDTVKQFWVNCKDADDKYTTLTTLYGLTSIGQSIIFVHTVATAKELANRMRKDGYPVSLLHGKDMSPTERDKVMDDFRRGQTTVLIATNVLARGIDVLAVTLVVNFDIPMNRYARPDPETYIHRIGRSGRFGRKGVAINFVCDDKSRRDLEFIAKHFNKKIEELPKDIEKASECVQAHLK